jgi:hypothetical protein
VSLDPPLHETFAFIHRRKARLSPATRALMTLAEQHLTSLGRFRIAGYVAIVTERWYFRRRAAKRGA